jgi:hypothetical protein
MDPCAMEAFPTASVRQPYRPRDESHFPTPSSGSSKQAFFLSFLDEKIVAQLGTYFKIDATGRTTIRRDASTLFWH